MLVPENATYVLSVVWLADMINAPGADTSGFSAPPFDGPRLLHSVIASRLSVAPTAMTRTLSAGDPVVLHSSPELPLAKTGMMAAFRQAVMTVSKNALPPAPPHEQLRANKTSGRVKAALHQGENLGGGIYLTTSGTSLQFGLFP